MYDKANIIASNNLAGRITPVKPVTLTLEDAKQIHAALRDAKSFSYKASGALTIIDKAIEKVDPSYSKNYQTYISNV